MARAEGTRTRTQWDAPIIEGALFLSWSQPKTCWQGSDVPTSQRAELRFFSGF